MIGCCRLSLVIYLLVLSTGIMDVNSDEEKTFTFTTRDYAYLIWHDSKVSWPEALDLCKQRNMHLASFHSAAELIKLNTFLMKQNFIDRPNLGNDYIYWIGGNDLKQAGNFTWAHSNEPFNFTHWLTGMPDNWRGDEHCVEMGYRVLGRWNDNRCWHQRHFICALEVQ